VLAPVSDLERNLDVVSEALCSADEKLNLRAGVVAQTCNPSYVGGRDSEDHGSRITWGIKGLRDPILTSG
jgi:hypothetical protein